MNDAEQIIALVKSQLPEVKASIDAPIKPDKRWYMDLEYSGKHVLMEWGYSPEVCRVPAYSVRLDDPSVGPSGQEAALHETLPMAAVAVVRAFKYERGPEFGEYYATLLGLFAAKTFIEDTSIAVFSEDRDARVLRCFNCDEFSHLAVWPEHGNPHCIAKQAMDAINSALESIKLVR